MSHIVLASESSIRRTLLAQAGITFSALSSGVDEEAVIRAAGALDPKRTAIRLAETKARTVSEMLPDAYVIGADQTLDLDGAIGTKPADLDEARARIADLSGRTHLLHSAFAIFKSGERLTRRSQTAKMTMRSLSDSEIDWYLRAADSSIIGSVGAYHLEELGIRLFEKISGDYFTVLGLPMIPLLAALRRIGVLAP